MPYEKWSVFQELHGLIVSSGHAATHVIPVLNQKPQLQSCARLNWGGAQAQEYFMKLLRLKYPHFPGKIYPEHLESYLKRFAHISMNFETEIAGFLDWKGLEDGNDIIIQYPFTEQVVVEKGLRCQPFSDQTLREMAISFPKSKEYLRHRI